MHKNKNKIQIWSCAAVEEESSKPVESKLARATRYYVVDSDKQCLGHFFAAWMLNSPTLIWDVRFLNEEDKHGGQQGHH